MCIDAPIITSRSNSSDLSQIMSKYGDMIMYLNIKKYNNSKSSKQVNLNTNPHELKFNKNAMKFASKVYTQLLAILQRLYSNLPLHDAKSTEDVLKCLLYGFRFNIAEIDKSKSFYRHQLTGDQLFVHPQSALFRANSGFVIFSEIVHTTKAYMKGVSYIQKEWIDSL